MTAQQLARPTGSTIWRVQWVDGFIDYGTEQRAEINAPGLAKVHGQVVIYPVVIEP